MADGEVRAQDLAQETASTLSGNEQFVMFDSTAGKRADIDDVATYVAGDKTTLKTTNKTSPVAAINENFDAIADVKEDYTGYTDNLFVFKDGTYNGVTVKRQSDGGLKITGTCTSSINCKQSITPFYGAYSLVCECADSIPASTLGITLRNASESQINAMWMDGKRGETNSTVSEANPISMIDLTFLSGKTYDYTVYIQLLNASYYKPFISPYSAVDRIARASINKGNDFVTPQMFGALGDGVHDDSTPIALALDCGVDVFFPEGTYLVTRSIQIPDGLYRHKIFADGDITRHNAYIKTTAFPVFINEGAGFTIDGLGFIADDFPDLTGLNPENRPFLAFYGEDDLDIRIENCHFSHNYCMIFAQGRNLTVRNNLFYDMGNTGYCIYLNYPENADGEADTNVNGFKNAYSGFRGFLIEGNRCHYTRNWLLNTSALRCRNIKGMVIRNNFLEGAFCVTGYLNNAYVADNVTFQVNHYDWTDSRRDACFNLLEMVNTVIDGYSCTGSDTYINKNGDTIAEAKYSAFIFVSGACKNNVITNIFLSNFAHNMVVANHGFESNKLSINARKTMNTNAPIGLLGGDVAHNMIDVIINDIRETPQEGQTIVSWYPESIGSDNIINVLANFNCIKHTGA